MRDPPISIGNASTLRDGQKHNDVTIVTSYLAFCVVKIDLLNKSAH